MSTSVSTAFVKQYEKDVHEAFQRRGSFLLGTVRHQSDVVGETTTFQKVGKGAASTKARHGQITPMNQSHDPVECTLADFYAGDWVDRLDDQKLSIDERRVIANAGAFALGRKVDEQILTAMDTTSAFAGDHSTGLTRTLLLQAVETLDANDVPDDGMRWGVLTPRQWSTALTIEEFASGDYVGDDLPFADRARVREWLGVKWMKHTGAPGKGTSTAKGVVWHHAALGYGTGVAITADITWHGDRAAFFVNHFMSGGACLIDGQGVVELRTDDTAAIPS